MSLVSSFEVLSLVKGRWELTAVVQDKAEALEEAERQLREGMFAAVEVIEERFDESTGESHSFVIFNKIKTMGKTKEQYTGKERREGKEWRKNPKEYKRQKIAKSRKGKERRKATFGEQMAKGAVTLTLILLVGVASLIYITTLLG